MANFEAEIGSLSGPILSVSFLKRTFPSTDAAIDLLLRFKSMLASEIEGIEQGLLQDDLEMVRFYTHRTRSGSLYLCIESIGRPATRLEELIDNEAPWEEIITVWLQLREACQRFLSYDRAEFLALFEDSGQQ